MVISCVTGVIMSPTQCLTRAEWLASHKLPDNARLFTLVAGLRPVKDPLYLVHRFSCKLNSFCSFFLNVRFLAMKCSVVICKIFIILYHCNLFYFYCVMPVNSLFCSVCQSN